MTYEVNGRTLEATESGYLVNQDDWDKYVAQAIAAADGLSLTQDHWDVIEYLAQQPCHPQGHWEGDLLFGSHNSQIATLVERQTRYVMLAKIEAKDTETVINALIKHAHCLPRELYQSLTWDRGKEMAEHKRFTLATDIKVYFCDPQNPWQRGSNENTNGLLRQYFPKGTDVSVHSQVQLNAVARRLNERPRKTLNYETPAERFAQCVASVG
jgi:IS30 family transposase